MPSILDQILVVDVEPKYVNGVTPEVELSEITKIGICVLDTVNLQRIEKRSFIIEPVQSGIDDHLEKFSSIPVKEIKDAMTFQDAIRILKDEYHSKSRLWASWGEENRKKLEFTCKNKGMEFPFGPNHLDIKMFAHVVLGIDLKLGMREACKELGVSKTANRYRCVDAAWNGAGILCRIIKGS